MQVNVALIAVGAGVVAVVLYLSAGAAKKAAGAAANAMNPVNPNNVFATAVNSIGGVLVSDPQGNGKNADGSWTLGGWLYDVTHGGGAQSAAAAATAPTNTNTGSNNPSSIDFGNNNVGW
jgi:hypothetical protein